jgi:glycosyltransferase involved in cell wall biosynthesis
MADRTNADSHQLFKTVSTRQRRENTDRDEPLSRRINEQRPKTKVVAGNSVAAKDAEKQILQKKIDELAALDEQLLIVLQEKNTPAPQLQHVSEQTATSLHSIYRTATGQFFGFYRTVRKNVIRKTQQKKKNNYQAWLKNYDSLTEVKRRLILDEIGAMRNLPLISVLMPVYNPQCSYLEEAIKSVQAQLYHNWELCIADDASSDPEIRSLIERYAARDSRITFVFRKENGHISEASNSALELAKGDYVALLDHDDLLHPLALYHVAREIIRYPDCGLIFSDEDKLNEKGRRVNPYFKCDFNYELFLCQNMICHLGVYKTSLVRQIGGFRRGYEGAQDYDLALRAIEQLKTEQIRHIPHVLYHWRIHKQSTSTSLETKPYALSAALTAVSQHLQRTGINATVEASAELPIYNRIRYRIPDPQPSVDIIIPTRDRVDLLKTCILSILSKTSYRNYTITVINNASKEKETIDFLAQLNAHSRIRIIHDNSPFNYSKLNNIAASSSSADYLCLMNNDIEVITPDWLAEMVGHAIQPGVGAVGARLWYPDRTLQHAGVVLGIKTAAGHAHKYLPKEKAGYFGRACLQQSFSAVTGACMLVKKEYYRQVGGLNEEQLQIAFNDIDLCLKLQNIGLRNIWTPYAELYHHESLSRGEDNTPEKRDRFRKETSFIRKQWQYKIQMDPAYSPNLTVESEDFSLAWPPRFL